MRILLTGSTGYVGGIIRKQLGPDHDVFCTSTGCASGASQFPCDLTHRDAVLGLLEKTRPDIVIHAAGNKNIDYCEKNPDEAFRVNCESVKNLATVFRTARIIYVSTDYVFDGRRGRYNEQDQPAPLTVYGRSKWCGETEGSKIGGNNFVILRASALYDENATFVAFLREKLSRNEAVECFADTVYSPTYYKDFMNILVKLLVHPAKGEVFHACGDAMTRYDFAVAFAKAYHFNEGLIKKSSMANRGMFLFPDLSMKNDATRQILQVRTTGTMEALAEMKRGSRP